MNGVAQWPVARADAPGAEDQLPGLLAAALFFFRARLSGDRARYAEDLAQETIIGAWQAFRRNPTAIESPGAFVLQIARNKLNTFLRRPPGRVEVPLEQLEAQGFAVRVAAAAAEQRVIERDLIGRIRRVLERLPRLERDVIVAAYLEGLAHDDLCERFGLSAAEASRIKWRAVERLRFELRTGTGKRPGPRRV